MKQINLYTGLLLILFTSSVFTGCDKEESLFGDRDVTSGMYELNVTSAGFVPAEGQSSENAEPINIPFVNDDAMGLVMVEGDKITHTRYMYKELLGKWSGDLTVKNPSAKIYAYYPYNEALEISSFNTQGTNAAEFFSQMIANFVPQADQSQAENFRKSNLMIGTASIDEAGKKISVNLESAMALAVVKVDPNQSVEMCLENDPNYKWISEGISVETLAPFYEISENCFAICIEKNKEVQLSESGFAGLVNISDFVKSTYKVYPLTLKYRLQAGDYYLNDGSLVSKGSDLSDEQKSKCIGIVFQTNVDRISDGVINALERKGVAIPHGLVMALKNAWQGVGKCQWSIDETQTVMQQQFVTLSQYYNNINGFEETNYIIDNFDEDESNFSAFYYISIFGTEEDGTAKFAAPNNSTGWFMPSIGQWWDIIENLGGKSLDSYETSSIGYFDLNDAHQIVLNNINNKLLKTGEGNYVEIESSTVPYYTSSEYNAAKVCRISFNGKLSISASNKTTLAYYRPVLAF